MIKWLALNCIEFSLFPEQDYQQVGEQTWPIMWLREWQPWTCALKTQLMAPVAGLWNPFLFLLRPPFPLASAGVSVTERQRQAHSWETRNSSEDLWFKNSPTGLPNCPWPQGNLRCFLPSLLLLGSVRHICWSDSSPHLPRISPPFSLLGISPNKILACLILFWHQLLRRPKLTQKLLASILIY